VAQNVLEWLDNADNETGFIVERKAEACAAATLSYAIVAYVGAAGGTGATVTYIDTDVVEGATYCYRVSAYNSGGTSSPSNTAQRTVPIGTSDTESPEIAIVTPTTNQAFYTTAAAVVRVTGWAFDNVALQAVYWWNETAAQQGSVNGLTDWWVDVPVVAGVNLVHFYAQDTSNNWSAVDFIIVRDLVAPTITIVTPAPPTYETLGATLDLAGTAADDVGLDRVTWVNDRGGSGVAVGTTAWAITALPLVDGVNVITVTARDLAGNTATAILTVTARVATGIRFQHHHA